MPLKEKLKHIAAELKGHAPFTVFGALAGVGFMLIFKGLDKPHAAVLFSILHPGHVVLSAMVTASIFTLHRKGKSFILILIVGYVGSIGIATLSDSVVPYIGEGLFGLRVPSHSDLHAGHDHKVTEADGNDDYPGLHIGFLEDWYTVNLAAVIGVLIAYFLPRTKFPHAGHVLISTWASSSHILMNTTGPITPGQTIAVFAVLFVAVWLPCCISDIVFPLLFVKSDLKLIEPCPIHRRHSHPHLHKQSGDKQ